MEATLPKLGQSSQPYKLTYCYLIISFVTLQFKNASYFNTLMCLIGEITNELSYNIPSVHVLFSVN